MAQPKDKYTLPSYERKERFKSLNYLLLNVKVGSTRFDKTTVCTWKIAPNENIIENQKEFQVKEVENIWYSLSNEFIHTLYN